MKQKKIVLLKIIAIYFFSILIAHSQDNLWMKYGQTEALRAMNLEYRHPKGYIGLDTSECFRENVELHEMLGCLFNRLQSTDGHFIAILSFETHSIAKDSTKLAAFDSKFKDGLRLDMFYINRIQNILRVAMGEEEAVLWEKHVQYYPEKEVKNKFNADIAITFPVKLSKPYKEIYNHCEALIIQRKRRGFAAIYYFYDDVAAKNIFKYSKAMEKVFRYGKEEPDLSAEYGIGKSSPDEPEYDIRVPESNGSINLTGRIPGGQQALSDNNIITNPGNNTISFLKYADGSANLTGAWLQCTIVNNEIRMIPGNMKIFRDNGTFSIYMSNTGREWTNGAIDSLTSNSYIERVASQTGSIFAGRGVPIRYSIEKTGENIILKSEYYMDKDRNGNPVCRWIPEYYVKISDVETEKIINRSKN